MMISIRERCHQFESAWLGIIIPPPRLRIEQSGWEVEEANPVTASYCADCGRTVPDRYFPSSQVVGCSACYDKPLPWLSVTRLGVYEEPLRRWIHDVKFRGNDAMGATLGRMLGQSVVDAGYGEEVDIVIPMPSTFRRRLRRGIDHAAVIAAATAAVLRRPVIHAIRKSPRPPQRAVSGSQRRSNVAGSIHAARFSPVVNTRVLLVDDIATTYASVTEAANVLLKQCRVHSVRVAVVAVTEDHHGDL